MEDKFSLFVNRRQAQFVCKCKTTISFFKFLVTKATNNNPLSTNNLWFLSWGGTEFWVSIKLTPTRKLSAFPTHYIFYHTLYHFIKFEDFTISLFCKDLLLLGPLGVFSDLKLIDFGCVRGLKTPTYRVSKVLIVFVTLLAFSWA